jgi:hypothetical protein
VGKTTAEAIAVSVWSAPGTANAARGGLQKTFATTRNGFELMAEEASGTVLAIDELGIADGEWLAEALYMLSTGQGRKRMSGDAEPQRVKSWITFIIFSGEQGLEHTVKAAKGVWFAGLSARFIDINVDDVNPNVDKQEMAKLEAAIKANYGHAGPAFVKALLDNGYSKPEGRGTLRQIIDEHAASLAGEEAKSIRRRAARVLAVVSVAGKLAKEFGLLPGEMDVDAAVAWAWRKFGESSESEALTPANSAISNISQWIAERWHVTIKPVKTEDFCNSHDNNRETVGWYSKAQRAIYINPDRLVHAAGGGLTKIRLSKLLKDNDCLARTRDEARIALSYVEGCGPGPFYALRMDRFGPEAVNPDANDNVQDFPSKKVA